MKQMLLVAALLAVWNSLHPIAAFADDTCKVVAEFSVELVKSGSMVACTTSRNPVACAIASASQSVAATGLAKKGVTALCNWTVTQAGDKVVVKATADAAGVENLRSCHEELKKIKGVKFQDVKF